MSLQGALSIGQSALAAAQASLQVTGNNIANVGNPNYARETANITDTPQEQISPGLFVGTGVDLSSVQRQVDDALNSRLNSSISDNQAATTTQQWLGQIQSVFNALGSNSLSSQLTSYLGNWSALANNPTDTSARQTVISSGQSLAQQINGLGGQLNTLQTQIGSQITSLAGQVTQVSQQIAKLNQQIVNSTGASGQDNGLLDQRDADVQQLSQLVNVQTINQGNGTVNVYLGSEPLVVGAAADGLNVSQQQVNGQTVYSLAFASDNANAAPTSGQLGEALGAQTSLSNVQTQLNTLAGGLINGVNQIYASGQGLQGYTSVTGTTQVLDPTKALNSAGAGLPFPPVNGSFVVTTTNTQTGLSSSTLVPVSLTGSPSDTTLNSLTASLNGIANVQASIQSGKLTIATNSPNEQITFSQDSSGVLASLGINTFFSGNSANNIGVNSVVSNNPSLLNAAQNGNPGDNQTALAIAGFASTNISSLNNTNWNNAYNSMITGIGTGAAQATSNVTATNDIVSTLTSQQQALSGVSLNEETINMLQQQRNFQGAAALITTINNMTQTLMQMIY